MVEKKVEIVYDDGDILVVNKPPLMVTTKEGRGDVGTLEDWLLENKKIDLLRSGIVHRLDKGTSGLVLVAKTGMALKNLKEQFKKRTIEKHYWAMVSGEVPREGKINMPIGRARYTFGKFGVKVDGKMAETWFKVITKYKKDSKIYSLLEIELKTGRTHQIRVHLHYLKWPIVGDKLYGGEMVDNLARPFLHAYEMTFLQPVTKKVMTVRCELPNDLEKVLSLYEKI